MQVIPGINAKNIGEVREQLAFFKSALPKHKGLYHLDVTDGKFSTYPLWNTPGELKEFGETPLFEIHLMIKNPESYIKEWLQPCVERILFHVSATDNAEEVIKQCKEREVEVGISLEPSCSTETVVPYIEELNLIQVLTVIPGAPGQKFGEESLGKIRTLRNQFPSVIIEVDGGINGKTAKLVKEAGANILISASYITSNEDPMKAYEELTSS
ncbi:MAG: hypothetical protein HZA35_03660 [Parcubacteria group bacterium]|nr:hypothetical protein [Parcubacteria group bacterium]